MTKLELFQIVMPNYLILDRVFSSSLQWCPPGVWIIMHCKFSLKKTHVIRHHIALPHLPAMCCAAYSILKYCYHDQTWGGLDPYTTLYDIGQCVFQSLKIMPELLCVDLTVLEKSFTYRLMAEGKEDVMHWSYVFCAPNLSIELTCSRLKVSRKSTGSDGFRHFSQLLIVFVHLWQRCWEWHEFLVYDF